MNRRARVVAEAVVSAVVLAVLLAHAGVDQVADALGRTRLDWLLPAVLLSIATIFLMAWRWRLLLLAKGIEAPIGWLCRTYFVALFAGQFLPTAIGGDAVRAVELGRRTRDAPESVASVLIDRLMGVVSLVALALLAFALGGSAAHRPAVVVAEAAFGLAAAAILAMVFSSRVRGFVARALGPRAEGRRLAAGQQFYEALHSYRNHRAVLAAVFGLALVVQAARIGVIWMLVKALGLHVAFPVILVTGPVVFAALVLPVSLNGIGVREAVFVYFLHPFVATSEAIALGLAFLAVGTATALVGAPVLVVRFIRHGLGAVRPRTRIEPAPDAAAPEPPVESADARHVHLPARPRPPAQRRPDSP